MAGKATAVFGIYHTGKQAERSGDDLKAAGFSIDDVSVLRQDTLGSKSFAHEKNTKAPEGATTGVTAGGAIGAVLGLLTGMGILALPGAGPFVAAGPVMCALAGLGAGGALGGLIGALVGMGIPEYEARRFKGQIKEGGILLSVHCDTSDEIVLAKDLLKQTGARHIASTGEASADYAAESTVAAQA